jgi:hypothetical protein
VSRDEQHLPGRDVEIHRAKRLVALGIAHCHVVKSDHRQYRAVGIEIQAVR